MSTTTNQESVLYRLRQLAPRRPLTQAEAYRVTELQANRLLEWSGVDDAGTPSDIVSGLPFVEVALRRDLPVSGLTNWFKPRWLILLNSTEPAVRQRFSLMHEFKHIIDHEGIAYLYPANWLNDGNRRAELVADYFAACLLMPKRLVKRCYGQGLHDVSELAAAFGVSTVAMAVRLQQLRLVEPTPRCDHGYRPPGRATGYQRRAWSPDALTALGAAA
ncbi:MAG: ImmA/IrrE family metallo-endopeptidase [Acidimicrobiales bacterium]